VDNFDLGGKAKFFEDFVKFRLDSHKIYCYNLMRMAGLDVQGC